jgi:hypothetical protein
MFFVKFRHFLLLLFQFLKNLDNFVKTAIEIVKNQGIFRVICKF